MQRAVLLLVALSAVSCVHGLGFVNPLALPSGLFSGEGVSEELASNRYQLFRDLFYNPTTSYTVIPLGSRVLLGQVGSTEFNNLRLPLDFFTSPVLDDSSTTRVGNVIAVGPDVIQRDLLRDGQLVVYTFTACDSVLNNGLILYLCSEDSIKGAVDTGLNTFAQQRLAQYQSAQRSFTPTLNGIAFNARDINAI